MNLQLPNTFCFKNIEEWLKWQCRFEQYCMASGLAGREEEQQVSTLLYCLGEDAEDILDATRITTDDKKKYDKVVEAFDNYFKVLKNISVQTYRRCGRGSHSRQTCPAQDTTCFCCNRKDHYSSQCLSTTAAEPKWNLSELTT